jgi:hypothetical protein
MIVIAPDFDRLVDLPGLGAVPRPVAAGPDDTGFVALLAFRIDELPDTGAAEEATGEDEILIALLSGACELVVTGLHDATFTLQADGDWAVYLPPRHALRLRPLAPCALAFARARPSAARAPRAYAPGPGGILAVEEGPERLRLRLLPLAGETDAAAGLPEGAERLCHLTGPTEIAGRRFLPAHSLALAPGERATVAGEGEILVVAALPAPP